MGADRTADMAHPAPPTESDEVQPFTDQATPRRVISQRRRMRTIGKLAAAGTLLLAGAGVLGIEPAKTIDQNIVGAAQNALNLGQHWDEGSSSSEKTPHPILVYTGEFDVSAEYVNNLHAVTFGGVKVSPDIPFYRIPRARFEETPQGPVIDVLITLADGSTITQQVACDPAAKVGEGPRDGAVVGTEGTIQPMADLKMPDGSPVTPGELSQAVPGTGSMPTPQP
jgi:hypothetical protein